MDSVLWHTDVSEFTRMLVASTLIVFFICFLFTQYNQFRKKPTVLNKTSQTHKTTQTLDEDFWISSSAEDNGDEYCDICEIMRQAKTYCTQCKQYLCIQCLKVHSKIRLNKDHGITNCANVTEKKLKSRHVALWSTYCIPIKSTSTLIGFSNTENKTDIRFVTQTTKTTGYPHYKDEVCLRFIDAKNHECISQNTISIKNKEVHFKEKYISQKEFYFVTGNELTYFSFRRYKSVCKMDENMETATVVFTTPGHCFGITKFDNGLALVHEQNGSFSTPKWQIHVYTFEGVLKQQILYDKERQALFERPEYLSANTEENILYATDTSKKVLYAFDTKGNILFIFQSKVMVEPRGISSDPEGNIYIACRRRVLQIQENGVKYRTILYIGKLKGDNCVEDVYFDRENTQLAVIEDFKYGNVFKFLRD
ncbi:uncharacterized protein LOC128224817 [Mya arenaria]|uniref:uncharacterized protein LOC128224817 n=1 Tax=Mya arenaria TaxID=6604 RepID=UPI0022DFB51B|nr:uncharacterized protein LOC128224817 [Mya arenaria]